MKGGRERASRTKGREREEGALRALFGRKRAVGEGVRGEEEGGEEEGERFGGEGGGEGERERGGSVEKKVELRRRRSMIVPASQEGRGVPEMCEAFEMKSRRSVNANCVRTELGE